MATQSPPVPTLSFDGWVKSSAAKGDYMFAHFYESEKSQTVLYGQNISSMQALIQENQGDMTRTCQAIREALSIYYGRYFVNVEAEVQVDPGSLNTTAVTLNIYVSFTDVEGKTYTLASLVEILDSKIKKVTKLNNTGLST